MFRPEMFFLPSDNYINVKRKTTLILNIQIDSPKQQKSKHSSVSYKILYIYDFPPDSKKKKECDFFSLFDSYSRLHFLLDF